MKKFYYFLKKWLFISCNMLESFRENSYKLWILWMVCYCEIVAFVIINLGKEILVFMKNQQPTKKNMNKYKQIDNIWQKLYYIAFFSMNEEIF